MGVTVLVSWEVNNAPEIGIASIEQAIEQAIQLGIEDPGKPVPFGVQPEIELTLTLTDDDHIRELNLIYRDLDEPTDVLSFSQIEGAEAFVQPPRGVLTLGDIVISLETANRQASAQGHSLERELAHLAVHGALHLLGYDHQADDEEAHMNGLAAAALKGGA